jgi:hypothetical protein
MSKCVKKYWWIILICAIVIYLIVVGVMNIPNINKVTERILNYIDLLITPLGVILGLILGYPLLKRKLIGEYVSKQFKIMLDANRTIGKKCLMLNDKYSIKNCQENLTSEYLNKAVEDLRTLYEMSIDANPYAYRYSSLVYHSLLSFKEQIKLSHTQNPNEQYYLYNVNIFICIHLNKIYKYSKSIGVVPNNEITKKKFPLTKINKFITGDIIYEMPGVNIPDLYDNASALLVYFYNNNNKMLYTGSKIGLLLQCCYKSAPTPSPFARLMFDEGIYIPLILDHNGYKLFLIGYERWKTMNSTSVFYSYKCIYANISSNTVFVSYTINNKKSFSQCTDDYIKDYNKDFKLVDDIGDNFSVSGEQITIEVGEQKVKEYFNKVKKSLLRKMKEELKNS